LASGSADDLSKEVIMITIKLGAGVECSDGPAGKISSVIVDPKPDT
jgi:hypothetical protein